MRCVLHVPMVTEADTSPDASSPTFANMIQGQVNLRDAIRRQIDFESGGKSYKLSENPAVLIVRYVNC